MDQIATLPGGRPAGPAASAQGGAAPAASGSKSGLTSDFETFLRMLTVQMQNQDPLNPVDSTEYATQLATFSSVEQQVLTNDLLKGLAETLGGTALERVSSWLGREALARAPVKFDGTPVTLRPDIVRDADAARLVVREAGGTVVDRIALDPAKAEIVWAGRDDTGTAYPSGVYRFEIESLADGKVIGTHVPSAYSRIDEVRMKDGAVVMRLADGTEIAPGQIDGLRTPDR